MKNNFILFDFDGVIVDSFASAFEVQKKYNVGPNNCVFVTDTLGDMKEASKLSVGTIGVTWGFNKFNRLLQGNPFRLIEKPRDLSKAISDYFTR